jgi:hypothetical protein
VQAWKFGKFQVAGFGRGVGSGIVPVVRFAGEASSSTGGRYGIGWFSAAIFSLACGF